MDVPILLVLVATASASAASSTESQDLKTELANTKDELAKARDLIAEKATGKLLSFGVTAGTALSVSVPPPWKATSRQLGIKVINLPYFMVLPGYWGTRQTIREYCASAWTGGDETKAAIAAQSIARRTAEITLDEMKISILSRRTIQEVTQLYLNDMSLADAARVYVLVDNGLDLANRKKKLESDREFRIARELIAQTVWDPTTRGRCILRQFGLWVGLPFNYTTRTTLAVQDSNVRGERAVDPQIAFGVAFTPHAYFSALLGVTYAEIIPGEDESEAERRPTWSVVAALGANLDLLGAIFQ